MKSRLVVLVALAGCASGSSALTQIDADTSQTDAKLPDAAVAADASPDAMADAMPDAMVDATPDAMPDAMVDAMVDAQVTPDACVPVVTQLLANPVFDLTPQGTGWQATPIDPAFPLITDQDGATELSAPFKAWLGGFVAPNIGQSVTDVLYQDVTIPAGTTQLTFTGYYAVGTQETTTTATYDTGSIGFTQTSGTPIVTLNSFSNLTPTTQWVLITYTFPQNMSGQTIRLRMTSSNDFSNVTNFFFDSFALDATHCP